jgi:acetyl esterase
VQCETERYHDVRRHDAVRHEISRFARSRRVESSGKYRWLAETSTEPTGMRDALPLGMRDGLESDTRAFLDSLATAGPAASVLEMRDRDSRMQAIDVAKARVDVEDGVVESLGHEISIRIVRPLGWKNGPLPVALFVHGGGWVVGGKDTHDRFVRDIAHAADVAVVFVDYSRSPEARYPVAVEEVYAALAWVRGHGQSLDLDPTRVALVGDSAGGNIVAAVTLLGRTRGGPMPDFQVLLCPATDTSFTQPSYSEFADGYFLTREGLRWAWDQYVPDHSARTASTVAPLRAQASELAGLPPALIITAEFDILRDEGEAYARRLMTAGVRVTATRYLGTIHAFTVLNPLAQTPAARAAVAQVAQTLRDALV